MFTPDGRAAARLAPGPFLFAGIQSARLSLHAVALQVHVQIIVHHSESRAFGCAVLAVGARAERVQFLLQRGARNQGLATCNRSAASAARDASANDRAVL